MFFPRLGIRVTAIAQEPTRTPTTVLPRNLHRVFPDTMLIRILPFDVFGTAIDTAAAIFAADTDAPRRIVIRVIRGAIFALFTNVFTVVELASRVYDAVDEVRGETLALIVVEFVPSVLEEGVDEPVEIDDDEEDEDEVVVGTTLSEPTATACTSGSFGGSLPTWPKSFLPQHFTTPVANTAQA